MEYHYRIVTCRFIVFYHFIVFLIDRYNDQLLPLVRQFLLIPNRNNKFMDLIANSACI